MPKETLRDKVLAAITATDSQSPFISPTQLADACSVLLAELAEMLGLRHQKEWMKKEELKRHFQISAYRCNAIIAEYHIPFRTNSSGTKFYSYDRFRKAVISPVV